MALLTQYRMIQVIYKNKMLLITFLRKGASLSFHFSYQVEANFSPHLFSNGLHGFYGFLYTKTWAINLGIIFT